MAEYETKFSGVKQEYASGATRDKAVGKGKYVFIPPLSLKRLAAVYERGAANHGDRNWEQGFPMSRALDSAIRHIYQYIEGMRDEDHLAQAAWNLFAAMHFEEMIERSLLPKELDDLPNYTPPKAQDYLLEPEDVEISAGRESSLGKVLVGYEPTTVTGPMGPTGVVGHAGPTEMVETEEKKVCANDSPPAIPSSNRAAGRVWSYFVSRHHLTPQEEEDFRHWYRGQGLDTDFPDYGRLLDEFFLWEEHHVRQSYGIKPSFKITDGYGYDDRKTLFGSVVGTPSEPSSAHDEYYSEDGTLNDWY
jgi:hypothetical protein